MKSFLLFHCLFFISLYSFGQTYAGKNSFIAWLGDKTFIIQGSPNNNPLKEPLTEGLGVELDTSFIDTYDRTPIQWSLKIVNEEEKGKYKNIDTLNFKNIEPAANVIRISQEKTKAIEIYYPSLGVNVIGNYYNILFSEDTKIIANGALSLFCSGISKCEVYVANLPLGRKLLFIQVEGILTSNDKDIIHFDNIFYTWAIVLGIE